jgi:hypothetical protein
MRVAKMGHIYTETKGRGRREVYNRRFPKDVQTLTGPRFVHKWPQGVTRQMANDDTRVPEQFNQSVATARAELARREMGLTLTIDRAKSLAEDRFFFERCVIAARVTGANTIHFGNPPPAHPVPDGEPFSYADAIDLWALYRAGKGRGTSDETRKRALSKLERLFGFLGHSDMRRVTEADLNRYVEQTLLGKWSASTVRDHIIMMKSIFALTHKKGRLVSNPTDNLEYERNTGNEREDFTKDERARIMRAAYGSNDPLIKWSNLLGGFVGPRIAEIAEAHTDDIVIEDGVPVFFVRKKNRVGAERTLKTKDSKRWFPIPIG